MSDGQEKSEGAEHAFISEWMDTLTNLWGAVEKSWSAQSPADTPQSEPEPETKKKTTPEQALQTFLKSFQTISVAFSGPESVGGLLKGAGVLPDLFLRIFQSAAESGLNLQKHHLEKMARIGAKTKAYQFDNLDQEMFRNWTEIYEKEFQQYLNIPPLGLNRFYVERLNQTQDSLNIFQTSLSEFLFVLYLPIEKSFVVMQQELAEKAENDELPENPGDYYRIWIKILEGHYMTLFQSSEYAAVLNRTVDAMSEFRSRKELVMGDIFQSLGIPTQKELDELYKDLYMTKKELRAIKKKLKDDEVVKSQIKTAKKKAPNSRRANPEQ